jgi:hypothetical protein
MNVFFTTTRLILISQTNVHFGIEKGRVPGSLNHFESSPMKANSILFVIIHNDKKKVEFGFLEVSSKGGVTDCTI